MRTVQFCLGMRKWWNDPVHATLKELWNKHELTWLRVTMSYHKLSNLREIFQGDLNRKLIDGIISCNFMDRPCNCNLENVPTMENAGKCVSYTKQPARYAISPTLDKRNKNLRIAWASILMMSKN
jgi:hypothetical protein